MGEGLKDNDGWNKFVTLFKQDARNTLKGEFIHPLHEGVFNSTLSAGPTLARATLTHSDVKKFLAAPQRDQPFTWSTGKKRNDQFEEVTDEIRALTVNSTTGNRGRRNAVEENPVVYDNKVPRERFSSWPSMPALQPVQLSNTSYSDPPSPTPA